MLCSQANHPSFGSLTPPWAVTSDNGAEENGLGTRLQANNSYDQQKDHVNHCIHSTDVFFLQFKRYNSTWQAQVSRVCVAFKINLIMYWTYSVARFKNTAFLFPIFNSHRCSVAKWKFILNTHGGTIVIFVGSLNQLHWPSPPSASTCHDLSFTESVLLFPLFSRLVSDPKRIDYE